jgi:hypothetical protein
MGVRLNENQTFREGFSRCPKCKIEKEKPKTEETLWGIRAMGYLVLPGFSTSLQLEMFGNHTVEKSAVTRGHTGKLDAYSET